MLRIHEDLKDEENLALNEMRAWALSQGDEKEQVVAKLAIAQRIINGTEFGPNDIWKMNAVGVLFGDALEHAMEGRLKWVLAEDEIGASFALSWKHTEVLVYPLTAIRSRLQNGEPVDVRALFSEYSKIFPFRQL